MKLWFEYFLGQSDFVVIFLHGLGGDSTIWSFATNYLRKKSISYLNLDLPGHGLSAKIDSNKPFSIEQVTTQIRGQVINKVGNKEFILVSHCLGSIIVNQWLKQFPQDKKRLKLILSFSGPSSGQFSWLLSLLIKLFSFSGLTAHRDHQKWLNSWDWDLRRLKEDVFFVGQESYQRWIKAFSTFHLHPNEFKHYLVFLGFWDMVVPCLLNRVIYKKYGYQVYCLHHSGHIPQLQDRHKLIKILDKYLRFDYTV